MPVIPDLGRQRQEDFEAQFVASGSVRNCPKKIRLMKMPDTDLHMLPYVYIPHTRDDKHIKMC